MSFYTLGISSSNHNSSICLLEDSNVVLAFPCERTSKEKHTHRIRQCDIDTILKYTQSIDLAVIVNVKTPTQKKSLVVASFSVAESVDNIKVMLGRANISVKKIIVDNGNHHLYHAAAGFYASGFDEATCLIIDGIGTRWVHNEAMLSETTTIFSVGEDFTPLYKNLYYKHCGYRSTG